MDGRVDRAQKLLEHLLGEMDSYHNHKESMAYAGLLVMLAICGGILSFHEWPPKWIPTPFGLSNRSFTLICVFVLWLLGHIYIRWQLRYRRCAAITYNGALRALAEWVTREPTEEDCAPAFFRNPSSMAQFFDCLFPLRRGTPILLREGISFPAWLLNHIQQEANQIRPSLGEWLITIGNIFIFIIIASRTWCISPCSWGI